MSIFLFYRQDDLDHFSEADNALVEASVYLVEAEDPQEALNILSDEVVLDQGDMRSFRVTPLTEGKSFARRLTIVD